MDYLRVGKKVTFYLLFFSIKTNILHFFAGEKENYEGVVYPACVTGCVIFPEVENYKPLDKHYRLPNDTIDYGCSKLGLMPHTGENLTLSCLENGTFVVTTQIPKCVRPETCREPFFPTHPRYVLANEDKVAYNHGDYIEV